MNKAYEYVRGYGQEWTQGVLSEHLSYALAAGAAMRDLDSVAVGTDVYPVLCSELVWVYTEDGRIDGRCGHQVIVPAWDVDGSHAYWCGAHAPSENPWDHRDPHYLTDPNYA